MSDGEADSDRYRTLVESVADPMYWLAPDGTVEMVNDAMVEFTGVPHDRLVGADGSAFLDDEDAAEIERLIAHRLDDRGDDRVRHEFLFHRPNAESRWAEANFSPVLGDDGSFQGSVGVVRDVTDRREREEALAKYETIVEAAPVGLFTLDEDAVVTWANEVYAETLSMPRDDLVGRPFPELIEAGYYDEEIVEPYLDAVRSLLSSESDAGADRYVVETHAEGKTLVHEVYTALLPLEVGEFRGTVSAFRDITTQQRYERELRRQNERLDEFASVVSHDLRNPLAIAEGYVERALETGDVDHLEPAVGAHDRMRALVDDLLSLARDGRSVRDPESVDVAAVARAAWRSTETGGATLDVTVSGPILADADRLGELFANLFRNSVEHGARGDRSTGALTVRVAPLSDGFAVVDDGAGFADADRDRLFEYGYTATEDGTGLGLAIVQTIAEAHGWTVGASEGDDSGARIEVRSITAA